MTYSVPFGTRIAGRYEVAGRPLMGGMGIVYLCYDHQEDRPVALKKFKPEYLSKRSLRDRFLREGTLWMDLDRHPHVVRCYGVERIGDGRDVYLVLEQVAKAEGKPDASLRAWLLPGQPLPLETALLFGLQIVRGMRHAVERLPGFVHRDLKPENVLVGADRMANSDVQRLRVTDFGLAGVLAEMADKGILSPEDDVGADTANSPQRTRLTHGVVGTPPYMAPEQWRGEKLTVATDVYAFGCILQEMLSGTPAVNGRSVDGFMAAHLQGKLLPLPKDIPGDIGQLVRRCVALDPGKRYGNWAELETALANLCSNATGMPVPALPEPDELSREERVALGWAQSDLGASYLDLGKAAVALDYFERAQAVGADEQEPRLQSAALGNLGSAYAALGQVEQAIVHHKQSLSIAREIGDRRGEGSTLGNLGLAYDALGQAEQAVVHFQQALTISREIGDRRGEGSTLGNLGLAYDALGQLEQAIDYHKQALAIAREIGDRRGEGNHLGNLGNAYLSLGQVEQAIDHYQQALSISREIGDRRGEGNWLGNLGRAYADLGQVEQAIDHYQQALTISSEIGDRRGEGNSLGNLGLAYAALGQVEQAIDHYQQALTISSDIGDRRAEGNSLGNLGSAYVRLGQVEQAIDYHKQALAISREIGDRQGEGNSLGNLGNAYADLGQVEQAIDHYQQALAISREIGDRRGEGTDLGNLGNAYADLGQVEQAIDYHKQALAIAREIGDSQREGNRLGNLGIAYHNLGQVEQAIVHYQQALSISREIGDLIGAAAASFNLALIYAQTGETAQALHLAQQAAQLFQRIGHGANAQRAQQLVARLQGQSPPPTAGDPQAAFQAFQQADSPAAMRATIARHPILTDPGFMDAIARAIQQQVPPQLQPAFQQRLDWLRQIAAEQGR